MDEAAAIAGKSIDVAARSPQRDIGRLDLAAVAHIGPRAIQGRRIAVRAGAQFEPPPGREYRAPSGGYRPAVGNPVAEQNYIAARGYGAAICHALRRPAGQAQCRVGHEPPGVGQPGRGNEVAPGLHRPGARYDDTIGIDQIDAAGCRDRACNARSPAAGHPV